MNTARYRTRLLLLALLAMALGLGWVWRESRPIAGVARTGATAAAADRSAAEDAQDNTQPVAPGNASKPAPALDGPLLDRIPALRYRAQVGDAKAACQLALELSACRAAAKREDLSRAMEYVAATVEPASRDPRVIESIASVREIADDVEVSCAGMDGEGDTDVVALLQAAAPAGSIRHRVIAALTQPDGSLLRLPRGPVHTLPIDPWVNTLASQFYADHALRYLREGFAARDPLALEGLILVHAPELLVPSASTDAAFRLPDPRRFVALGLLAEQVYGADMLGSQVRQLLQRTVDTLPAHERERAEREAAAWTRTWRASEPLPPPDEGLDAESIDTVCQ